MHEEYDDAKNGTAHQERQE
jgi:chromosome segregation ATPase